MQALRALVATLASLVLANWTLWRVLNENLVAGRYPIDADSIGIPLAGGGAISLVILVSMGVSVSLPKRNRVWLVARAVSALFALLLALGLSAHWFHENHYSIAAAFLTVAGASLWSWWQVR